MVFGLRVIVLGLLLTNISFAGEPLEITIYAFRSPSDLQYKTYTYDYLETDSYKNFNKVSSLNIVQSGAEGQMSSTFLRGTNSNHTLLTFNGMPIKDHSTPTGVDDISQHSMLGVNSVEIIKGPMSTVYGPNAVGGVINMTSYATDENYIDFSTASNNTNTQKVKVGKWYGKNLFDFSFENKASDGISVYPQGSEKDGFSTQNYSIKTTHGLNNGWWVNTNINKKHNEADLDGSGSDVLNYTSDWDFSNQYIDILDGKSKLAFNNVTHKREYDKAGTKDNYNSNTKTLLGTHTFNFDKMDVNVGAEHEHIKADFNTNIDGYVSSVDKERNNNGYFVNINKLLDKDFIITGGLRLDTPSAFDEQLTYRLGTNYNGFRLTTSTAYKAPTIYEMYGSDNWGFLGNANLKPENSKTYEVGYGNKNVDFAFYKTYIDNQLIYQGNTYQNDSSQSIRKGADVTLKWQQDSLRVVNSTGFSIAEDSSGNELTRRPKWQNNLSVTWNKDNLSLGTNWNFYGKHKDIDSATYDKITMPDVSVFDLTAQYKVGNSTIYSGIDNVFDKQYERPDGYNQNGRYFKIGIKHNF